MQGELGEVTPMIGSVGHINVGGVVQVFLLVLLFARQLKRSLTPHVAEMHVMGTGSWRADHGLQETSEEPYSVIDAAAPGEILRFFALRVLVNG